MVGTIERWSESRNEAPVDLGELADKNVRAINPLASADLYFEVYDKAAARVEITDPATGETKNYELIENINDPDSGFHAKVIKDTDSGHHVLLAKGMDMLSRDEGDGKMGFAQDIKEVGVSGSGCISDQVLASEQAYLNLLEDPNVTSIEIIGYSMGSIPANFMASVYGAEVTNVADLGVPGTGAIQRSWAAETFNLCSNGMFPGAHGAFKDNLDANVIGLDMNADVLGAGLGSVGTEFGTRIDLDGGALPDVRGVGHVPEMYAKAVREVHDAPETTTTETLKVDNWKPIN